MFIFTLLQQLTPMQSDHFAATLWKRKNLKLWQQTNGTDVQVTECAKQLMKNCRRLQVTRSGNATYAYIICTKEIVDNTHLHKPGCWNLI